MRRTKAGLFGGGFGFVTDAPGRQVARRMVFAKGAHGRLAGENDALRVRFDRRAVGAQDDLEHRGDVRIVTQIPKRLGRGARFLEGACDQNFHVEKNSGFGPDLQFTGITPNLTSCLSSGLKPHATKRRSRSSTTVATSARTCCSASWTITALMAASYPRSPRAPSWLIWTVSG